MKQKPRRKVLNYFTFTRSERVGTLVLVVILVLIIMAPFLYRNVLAPKRVDRNIDYREVEDFFADLTVIQAERTKKADKTKKTKYFSIENEEVEDRLVADAQCFIFDPNKISEDSLMLLGLSAKQSAVVCNYRNKGGIFRKPDDFAKIYSIDPQTHIRLLPFISIDTLAFAHHRSEIENSEQKSIIVELNSADSVELCKIRGIGATYAKRIISYRSLLGGFYTKAQLKEVYGISNELYNKILPSIALDSTSYNKINLNTVTYESLRQHPYFSDFEAKSIIYYRSKAKTITSPDDILKNKLISLDKFEKVKPYLIVK